MKNSSKLNVYLSAGAAILAAGEVKAQINYTDIDPDEVLDFATNSFLTRDLDIDQDGTPDFQVQGYSSFWTSFWTTFWTTQWSTSYGGYYTYTYTYTYSYTRQKKVWTLSVLNTGGGIAQQNYHVDGILANDSIDNSRSFQSSGMLFYSYQSNYFSSTYGNWASSAQNLFAGVSIFDNNQHHYGWIRMSMNGPDQLIIHDMAINDSASVAIAAGDTAAPVNSASLLDPQKPQARIWTHDHELTVLTSADFGRYTLIVADMSGKEVERQELTPGDAHKISAAMWNRGAYVAYLKSEYGRMVRRKFFIR